ncbi:MAG: cofactor-independent phosphoglycerate mutase [Candidatus Omnitrophica bacterium]|nr:cofactor-independent phosphoglycerate mutase [Candidatus Omnitrophota bacterium]MDD5487448.1 cofactor-independent phosphoglycerate mutase [Candidatus Omnitrophota bacterium]
MKYIILVPDGMAGEPLEELNDRTCMEVANAPGMNLIAKKGIVGISSNVPKGMTPASDVANLSILGYDPRKYYCGRGPLEAANLGVDLGPNDVAFRFNMVSISDGIMADYSAGHISTKETDMLVKELDRCLGSSRYRFYTGTSYRNLLVIKCSSRTEAERLAKTECFAPHDILDQPIDKYYPKEQELVDIMVRGREVLKGHDINKVRIDLGQNPADMIWVWGQGKKPDMPLFSSAYGLSGAIISAVDLLKGMGKVLGLRVIDVPGATGYYDTDYSGKAEAALEALDEMDMVFIHVEAPDEAGHNGDILEKIKAIENFDSKITSRVLKAMENSGKDFRVLISPDHPTPVKKRTHTSDPVPFAIAGKGVEPDGVTVFSEKAAKAGSMELKHGHELMKLLISK